MHKITYLNDTIYIFVIKLTQNIFSLDTKMGLFQEGVKQLAIDSRRSRNDM